MHPNVAICQVQPQAPTSLPASILAAACDCPNRLGQGANVYLASAELASVAAVLGKLPTVAEYMEYAGKIDSMASDIYRYMNFDRMPEYAEQAGKINVAQLA